MFCEPSGRPSTAGGAPAATRRARQFRRLFAGHYTSLLSHFALRASGFCHWRPLAVHEVGVRPSITFCITNIILLSFRVPRGRGRLGTYSQTRLESHSGGSVTHSPRP